MNISLFSFSGQGSQTVFGDYVQLEKAWQVYNEGKKIQPEKNSLLFGAYVSALEKCLNSQSAVKEFLSFAVNEAVFFLLFAEETFNAQAALFPENNRVFPEVQKKIQSLKERSAEIVRTYYIQLKNPVPISVALLRDFERNTLEELCRLTPGSALRQDVFPENPLFPRVTTDQINLLLYKALARAEQFLFEMRKNTVSLQMTRELFSQTVSSPEVLYALSGMEQHKDFYEALVEFSRQKPLSEILLESPMPENKQDPWGKTGFSLLPDSLSALETDFFGINLSPPLSTLISEKSRSFYRAFFLFQEAKRLSLQYGFSLEQVFCREIAEICFLLEFPPYEISLSPDQLDSLAAECTRCVQTATLTAKRIRTIQYGKGNQHE